MRLSTTGSAPPSAGLYPAGSTSSLSNSQPQECDTYVCNIPHRTIERTKITYLDKPTQTSQGGHPFLGFPSLNTLNMRVFLPTFSPKGIQLVLFPSLLILNIHYPSLNSRDITFSPLEHMTFLFCDLTICLKSPSFA